MWERAHRVNVLHVYKDQHVAVLFLPSSALFFLSLSAMQRVAAAGRGSDAERATCTDENRVSKNPVTKSFRESKDESWEVMR